MSESQIMDYYARRERQERDLAERASSPEIGNIHRTLARNYAEMIGTSDASDRQVAKLRLV